MLTPLLGLDELTVIVRVLGGVTDVGVRKYRVVLEVELSVPLALNEVMFQRYFVALSSVPLGSAKATPVIFGLL